MDNNHDNNKDNDIIDEDLYEEFEDEELYELVQEERRKALERAKNEDEFVPKRPFHKWAFWLISIALAFNMFALLPQTFSIPAIDFLMTSAKLSTNTDVENYKKAVVVVETENSKGTGFSIAADGTILTNNHVVEGEQYVTVAFPEDGLFTAEVTKTFPEIDLAVLQVEGRELPYLTLAEQAEYTEAEPIRFIGNPLRFNGIANEGKIIGGTKLSDWDEEVIMIEAPVYRGNSGSPIINQEGKVLGVIFATADDEEYGKVGLFIPIDLYYKYATK
ncbi:serine protease [Oceanobacillus massiliensis]|uniref:S1C family serine protease n=1 Tax=Oceanobacillus massiliensis TaxID=1465765 RepID=UPI003018DC8C